jgi:hypothetical protein
MGRYLKAFGRFWWEFLVGDTPEIALGAVLVLGLAFWLDEDRILATILLPVAVAALLTVSVLRGRRG